MAGTARNGAAAARGHSARAWGTSACHHAAAESSRVSRQAYVDESAELVFTTPFRDVFSLLEEKLEDFRCRNRLLMLALKLKER
jgi:hypothetical protein